MTVDTGRAMPLPSGPATLCFDKDEFMKPDFDVDVFIMECRRRVQLETLRDDLTTYLKILRSAMIELINKDYADFVNLSTNLVGMDKAITNLTVPLGQLREEVLSVKMAMDQAIAAVEEKLREREQIRQKKKIEKLLGINVNDGDNTPGRLTGQLIERVANEFNKLQFYVTKSKGLPLVEMIKPRIANITTTLQFSLEGQFIDGLQSANTEVLRQCLRTYSLIDKIRDAENLFRQHVVKPYMEEVISEQFLRTSRQGLQGMYTKILDFIPQKCKLLKDVTSGNALTGSSEIVRGYDFLVNAVWPEIIYNIEARTPSIFAPGNPNVFHEKFLTSMLFLERFERQCGSQASVKRLREHQSYHAFMTKWSLPVYFQIRFQEIASSLETALCTAFNKAADTSEFHLHSTLALWVNLHQCWRDEIFLDPLCHKFWKLTLQMLSRYSLWLDEVYDEQISKPKELEKKGSTASLPSLADGGGAGDKAPSNGQSSTTDTHSGPITPVVTVGQILCLISDAEKISAQIFTFFDDTVKPRVSGAGFQNKDLLKNNIQECSEKIKENLPRFQAHVVEEIILQCSAHLRQVNDIPRLYRRTNREVPSKPSTYISSLLKPLQLFVDEHESVLGQNQKIEIFQQVFTQLGEQYHSVTADVLLSVKKMEDSLKKLRKVRGTDKSSGSQGMTDDDKIRTQLVIDIENYGRQISSYGIQQDSLESYNKLLQLSSEAKAAMTSQS
ncbi:hypothetical protein KUTeg_013264 [Tegillarca granosa]|uniref:Conserved oligomeric Golgi complex subunit 2 n=1 Tax=Tegillarca granosa TaxID=220873 RepID=A0ABQ9ETA8_TEGGR|nr:hypothetical protein KUTeg_013264 [Tegillarca granosa]